MPRMNVVNLIRVFADRANAPEVLHGMTPRRVAERVRDSCAFTADGFGEWSEGIIEHCVIPPGHPYGKLLAKHKVPDGDPLWTLGAIAYGTQSPWIVIRRIRWDDGREDFPDAMERKWILSRSA